MSTPTVIPPPPRPLRPVTSRTDDTRPPGDLQPTDGPRLHIEQWVDPVADPHGLHPCSRYVELYWLPIIGPSTTWLLRRLTYGLEVHGDGFDLHLPETARSLGLGDKMGKNSPFRRALARLAASVTAKNGVLSLASCSHNMPAERFAAECAAGILRSGRTARLIRSAGASPDHPVHPMLPESAYLKALVFALD